MISFNIIVAVDQKMGIGKNGSLPWKLKGDMKHFKTITTETISPELQNVVLMGRKTWESIPEQFRPLDRRINVVLTQQKAYALPDSVKRAADFDEAINHIISPLQDQIDQIFVIGGEQVFRIAVNLPQCEKIFLTRIDAVFDCDVFFPEIPARFKMVSQTPPQEDHQFQYYFQEYGLLI